MLTGPDDPGDELTISPVPKALVLQSAVVNPAADGQFPELLQGRGSSEDFSPAHHIRPGLPPMCFVHGMADDLVPYTSVKEFVAAMERVGNTCELHIFEGTDHFFRNKPDQVAAMKVMETFVLSTLV
jgi:dipeptidyl aminopeptidase/acylaminoacyl peptidase